MGYFIHINIILNSITFTKHMYNSYCLIILMIIASIATS